MRTVLCLTGPTASGKSAAALALAREWPLEIISVDSATIYRGMDIGTAKPSLAEQGAVPHHLLDIRDPAESYSAAEFRDDAQRLIAEILERARLPVLCGGTMLYFRALRYGLANLPPADLDIRAEIEAQAARRGWPSLHDELMRVDPVTAQRLAPMDSQRIQRALEVHRLSGRPMSVLLASQPDDAAPAWRYLDVSLEPADRAALYQRIEQRYARMLEQGLLEEVRQLHARPDLHMGLPSMRCVGYRQLWEHLDGRASLEAAVENAVTATRRLAKRQLTWLRAQPHRHVVDCLAPDAPQRVLEAAKTAFARKSS